MDSGRVSIIINQITLFSSLSILYSQSTDIKTFKETLCRLTIIFIYFGNFYLFLLSIPLNMFNPSSEPSIFSLALSG